MGKWSWPTGDFRAVCFDWGEAPIGDSPFSLSLVLSIYLSFHSCRFASSASGSQFRLICLPNPPAYKYTATPTVNGVSRSLVITSPTTLRPCTSVPLSPFPRSVRFLSFPASAFGRAFVKFPFVALNRRDTSCGACWAEHSSSTFFFDWVEQGKNIRWSC